ncbi:hypothetical protein [Staphylococcus marylandisciuri]|uniref:hypothetical protein n=1 Tax=Staphylococcus marylandisciuri TaxID=2981529 RepID=UPI0021D08F03|nr:hypothetical protein [Staphylococcus marylandisciuri]
MGWGPNKEKLVNQFPQAQRVGAGLRNLFIQIRVLSRSRIVSVVVDDPAFRMPLIGFSEHRYFILQSRRFSINFYIPISNLTLYKLINSDSKI